MRANTPTLLSLAEFFEVLGFHPFYAAQLGLNVPARTRGDCQTVLYQDIWQNSDNTSREEIANAIKLAEDRFYQLMGFYPAPQYITAERHQYPSGYDKSFRSTWSQPGWKYKTVQLNAGFLTNVGTELLTLAEAGAPISPQDYDNDGFNEAFSVSATVPLNTDASDIVAFFIENDRVNNAQENYEIRPLKVTVSGTTATITGGRYLLLRPELALAYDSCPADAVDNNSYVTQLDVYIRTTDQSESGTLTWVDWYQCPDSLTSPCNVVIDTACFQARDLNQSVVAPIPATWDADLSSFVNTCCPNLAWSPPTYVEINYLAGWPRQANGRMLSVFAQVITRMAINYLPPRKCGCARVDIRWEYWNSFPTDGRQNTFVTPEQLNNPLGGSNGLIEAWNLLQPYIQFRGVAVLP